MALGAGRKVVHLFRPLGGTLHVTGDTFSFTKRRIPKAAVQGSLTSVGCMGLQLPILTALQ